MKPKNQFRMYAPLTKKNKAKTLQFQESILWCVPQFSSSVGWIKAIFFSHTVELYDCVCSCSFNLFSGAVYSLYCLSDAVLNFERQKCMRVRFFGKVSVNFCSANTSSKIFWPATLCINWFIFQFHRRPLVHFVLIFVYNSKSSTCRLCLPFPHRSIEHHQEGYTFHYSLTVSLTRSVLPHQNK